MPVFPNFRDVIPRHVRGISFRKELKKLLNYTWMKMMILQKLINSSVFNESLYNNEH